MEKKNGLRNELSQFKLNSTLQSISLQNTEKIPPLVVSRFQAPQTYTSAYGRI